MSEGSNPRRFIISPQNGRDLCANGRVGQAHTDLSLAIPFENWFGEAPYGIRISARGSAAPFYSSMHSPA